ncbi:hypothetical protein CHS0354_036659 [Potamilus streckersoni]|uniref:Uncharacterized protein n=1 Tax=Potamilus streckersoni TaxID=2493646 RepID=A0AAE0TGN1_9BIVA|nr:hypothetical protein CHS0354_036659 [Potamilus streckersoni]
MTHTSTAVNKEKIYLRKSYRTERHSQISRWETIEETDNFGIDSWMKRQTQLKLKRENKESKAVSFPQSDEYTLPVQNKCAAIENVHNFESQSLHKSLVSSPPSKKWKQSVSRDRKSVLTHFKYATKDSMPDAFFCIDNLKVRTDKDFSRTNDGKERYDTGELKSRLSHLPKKRCRSAPETHPKNSDISDKQITTSYHKPTGILSFSKSGEIGHNNGKGNSNHDEDDDEGYSSKTSSAEDKGRKRLFDEFQFRRMCTSMIDLSLLPSHIKEKGVLQSRFKFFHSHQSKKLPTNYDIDYDEEGDNESDRILSKSKTVNYLDAGVLLQRRNKDGCKGIVPPVENTTYFKVEEMKQMRLVLRKISIQDSDEANAGTFPVGERTGKLDPIPNIDRSRLSSRTSTASRQQQGTLARPYSNKTEPLKKSVGRHSVNSQKYEHENSHSPYSIGDLLPTMDRNIYNSRRTRTFDSLTQSGEETHAKMDGVTSSSLDNPMSKKLLISPTNGLMFLRTGLDFVTNNIKKQNLGPPPFCPKFARQPLSRQVTSIESLSKPPNYQGPNPLTPSQGRPLGGKPEESKSRVPVLPDKETKKKLQDAFSKFYNKKSNIIGQDLVRSLKNMWKS